MITPREGEQIEQLTEEQRLSAALYISEWEPKPTLLYFHIEHDDAKLGKASLDQCKALDDEKVARWSQLYNCVEVNVAESSDELLQRFGYEAGPSFAVVDNTLNVVATSKAIGSSKKFNSFLQKTLKSHFGEYWKDVQEQLDEQKKLFQEAKSLARKKDLERARDRLHEVRISTLRIGDWWDDARKEAERLDRELTD